MTESLTVPPMFVALMLILSAALNPAVADADDYATSFEHGMQLQEEGRVDDAIQVFQELATEYPQDFAVALQLGWLHYSAARYSKAEHWYQHASQLSDGALDAQLGLAWTHIRQERMELAREELDALLEEYPDDDRIADAQASLRSEPDQSAEAFYAQEGVEGLLSSVAHLYSDDSRRDWGLTIRAGLSALFAHHVSVGVSYGFSHLDTPPGDVTGNDPMGRSPHNSTSDSTSDSPSISQHEVWGSAAVYWPVFGAQVVGGWLTADDERSFVDQAWAIGAILRLSLWGDLLVEAGTTRFDSGFWTRVAPSYRLPLHQGWALTIGGALQSAPDRLLGSGLLEVEWRPGDVRLFAGGRYGRESQPTYLALGIFNNIAGDILLTAWLGAELSMSWSNVSLIWSLEQQEPDDSQGSNDQIVANFITLSIDWWAEIQ